MPCNSNPVSFQILYTSAGFAPPPPPNQFTIFALVTLWDWSKAVLSVRRLITTFYKYRKRINLIFSCLICMWLLSAILEVVKIVFGIEGKKCRRFPWQRARHPRRWKCESPATGDANVVDPVIGNNTGGVNREAPGRTRPELLKTVAFRDTYCDGNVRRWRLGLIVTVR